jgi:hypothetical protein
MKLSEFETLPLFLQGVLAGRALSVPWPGTREGRAPPFGFQMAPSSNFYAQR